MVDRESRIATAHESTFQWVLQDHQSQDHRSPMIRWLSVREWLESDDQLYWITGKAGSGKSTLMKYLCSPVTEISQADDAQEILKFRTAHQRVRCYPYLEKWAGSLSLVVASFYFWNSGMELQMTQVGLLRALLYQLVVQRPDILPMIASKHWESQCLFDDCNTDWSAQDLHDMISRAVMVLRMNSKICFFIDGLDEFGYKHDDLIFMVKDLIRDNNHVKICVASRPWNVFQTAFGRETNLRLEELTFDDIKLFVQSRFQADTEFENLRRRYPPFADQLMDNIVTKASGVFLWVDLVVTSLLAGMWLGDRIEDFQRRLDELPPDLENLYEKILHNLDPFYLEHAAQYFALIESTEAPLTILEFSFADEESPESAIKMQLGPLTEDEISVRIEAMNRRLNSRCKGFLETDRALQSIKTHNLRHSSQLTVQYLHRTVRDFIKSPKAQEFLQPSTNPDFDPSIQLFVTYLMTMKTWDDRQEYLHILDRYDQYPKSPSIAVIIQCLKLAGSVANGNDRAMTELLEELKRVISLPSYRALLVRSGQISPNFQTHPLSAGCDEPFQTSPTFKSSRNFEFEANTVRATDDYFLSIAVMYNIVAYVKVRAKSGGLIQRSTLENSGGWWPLLLDALSGDVPEPKMVECLLDLGADPNFKISKVDSQTPWIIALTKAALWCAKPSELQYKNISVGKDKWKQTLKLMFSRGASSTKKSESLLTPTGREILQALRDEVERSRPGWNSWLRFAKGSNTDPLALNAHPMNFTL